MSKYVQNGAMERRSMGTSTASAGSCRACVCRLIGLRSTGLGHTPRARLPARFFEFPASQLPPTSGAQSVDVNGDGVTCVRLIATDANGTGIRFVAVDNASNVP
jgi:hypothetical protein